MGALYWDYLGPKGLAVASRSFVRPVCQHAEVDFMGALATLLSKFDRVQRIEWLCVSCTSVSSCYYWIAL